LEKLENEQPFCLMEKDLERTKDFFLHPKKLKKAFFKVDLNDKLKMVANTVWNVSIANKKLANINFKEPFEALANCAKNDDIDNLRGCWDYVGTVIAQSVIVSSRPTR